MVFSGSGSGTSEDPYIITTVEQLQEMSDYLSSYFELGNDIDASKTSTWNSGEGFVPIGTIGTAFTGNLEGNNYIIDGLYINRSSDYQGLFGYTNNGSVSNVGLTGCSITGSNNVGSFVGFFTIGSTLSGCYSTGNVSGINYVGGMIGRTDSGTVTNCYTKCSSTGTDYVGGLTGQRSGTLSHCYSTGVVTGSSSVGGLVGSGIGGSVIACFWDTETSGQSSSPGGGTGLTTVNMKLKSSYSGWDFTDIWFMPLLVNDGYPALQLFPTYPTDYLDIKLHNGTIFRSMYLTNLLCNPLGSEKDVIILNGDRTGTWRQLGVRDIDTPTDTKTANYTVLETDVVLFGNATSGNIVLTLPNADGLTGKIFIFKKIDSSANTVTIDASAHTQSIDESTSKVLSSQYESVTIISYGSGWYVI